MINFVSPHFANKHPHRLLIDYSAVLGSLFCLNRCGISRFMPVGIPGNYPKYLLTLDFGNSSMGLRG